MYRIVLSITTLQQHIDSLELNPQIYKPSKCPYCGFGTLWNHGCYERQADRISPSSESLNPVSIPRFLCAECGRTCSRLPECIAPRRWYSWALQGAVFLMLLNSTSCCGCAQSNGVARSTVRRWWSELKGRSAEFEFTLRSRFAELGRAAGFEGFWQACLQMMPLSRAMAFLDQEGVVVP